MKEKKKKCQTRWKRFLEATKEMLHTMGQRWDAGRCRSSKLKPYACAMQVTPTGASSELQRLGWAARPVPKRGDPPTFVELPAVCPHGEGMGERPCPQPKPGPFNGSEPAGCPSWAMGLGWVFARFFKYRKMELEEQVLVSTSTSIG